MIQPMIYLVPRWAGNIHSDWYDWLVEQVFATYQIEIKHLEMPNWQEPQVEESLEYLSKTIQHLDEHTYFIGHSVGCQSILRYLSSHLELNNDLKIGGILLVAAWFEVDKPWISLVPWMNHDKTNFSLIAKAVNYKKVILSNNDPFTSDFAKNKAEWENKIQANVGVFAEKLHFNTPTDSAVLAEVEKMILFAFNQ